MHTVNINSYFLDVSTSNASQAENSIFDYSIILDRHSTSYKLSGCYWQVGPTNTSNTRDIYLSAIVLQIRNLFDTIIPILLTENASFQIVKDSKIAEWILDGQLGSEYLCKIICIYPSDDRQFIKLIKTLIDITSDFKGPAIPAARWLGSILYTPLDNTVNWPFADFTLPTINPQNRLLNSKYYPTSILKNDAKGNVIKAIYFKHIFQISTCLIKQGRRCMYSDQYGRDIQDRLHWQYDLYHHLAHDIPLPKVLDYFHENEDSYLVMDFIKALSFSDLINQTLKDRRWIDIDKQNQVNLLNHYINILNIISLLHKKGFIHRDITPANFLITKKGKIYLIDLELMWNSGNQKYLPPFSLGTYGFMSPEQFRSETPTYKQDIYALGALLLQLFTNLQPIKWNLNYQHINPKNIYFFTKNRSVAKLITACLEIAPDKRPDVDEMNTIIQRYRDQILKSPTAFTGEKSTFIEPVTRTQLYNIIQAGINGLSASDLLNVDYLWLSTPPQKVDLYGNENYEKVISNGWYRGIAGPLWLLSIAETLDFNVQSCSPSYNQAQTNLIQLTNNNIGPQCTLYDGLAGVAVALAQLSDNKQSRLPTDQIDFSNCFSKSTPDLSLARGIAGQGLALLKIQHKISAPFLSELLAHYIELIIQQQEPDGKWPTIGSNRKTDLSFNTGVTGIIWFLLNYIESNPNKAVLEASIKGLKYLLNKAILKISRRHVWMNIHDDPYSNRWGVCLGIPGIILTLIKAYEITGDSLYKGLSEQYLNSLPECPVHTNFSLSNGLAGMGELYLEAARVFNEPIWQDRSNWILGLFANCIQHSPKGSCSWVANTSSIQTADLFSGNSGILHFLLLHYAPGKVDHVLSGPNKFIFDSKYCAQSGDAENL